MGSIAHVDRADYEACFATPAEVFPTALGPLEYARRGQGPVLLTAHGGPGGYDQSLCLGEVFRKNGFTVIGVSRPGYLGTPLSSGATHAEQADLLAAFIKEKGLAPVAVVGASAGGPPTYLLAQRHPSLVKALIEIDSVCLHYTKMQEISKVEEMFYLSKTGLWLMDFFVHHVPSAVVKSFLKSESTLEKHELGQRVKEVLGDDAKLALVEAMARSMTQEFERRKPGLNNDVVQLQAIDQLPLDRIACPTLIIQGEADADAKVENALYAHRQIAGSQLHLIPTGSHLGFWTAPGAQVAQERAVAWLREQV